MLTPAALFIVPWYPQKANDKSRGVILNRGRFDDDSDSDIDLDGL